MGSSYMDSNALKNRDTTTRVANNQDYRTDITLVHTPIPILTPGKPGNRYGWLGPTGGGEGGRTGPSRPTQRPSSTRKPPSHTPHQTLVPVSLSSNAVVRASKMAALIKPENRD
ncbi:Hypothetical predicted protein [Pelobates cultripes]|uniref:Uncharacterized protein n=1 Tax=Pelobates cultripes TaxID=61616 RepID=A0AAD1SAA7_PELCU|nr:Hypothetical predicted protein [Pelobates cultripes]